MWVKNCAVTPSIPPPSLSELYKILTFSKVEKYLRSARFKSFPSAAEMNICVATHPKLLDGKQSLVSDARHICRGLLNGCWTSDVRDFRGSCVLLRDLIHPVPLTFLSPLLSSSLSLVSTHSLLPPMRLILKTISTASLPEKKFAGSQSPVPPPTQSCPHTRRTRLDTGGGSAEVGQVSDRRIGPSRTFPSVSDTLHLVAPPTPLLLLHNIHELEFFGPSNARVARKR